jgi:hypothetical protein
MFMIGLFAAYTYPLFCCGLAGSRTGSTDKNRPRAGLYARAPTCVRPGV